MEAQADKIIDPNGLYSKEQLAGILDRSTKQIERQWQAGDLPKPFYQGRRPYWTGKALLEHFQKKQDAATQFAGV